MGAVRRAAVAGTFYPADPQQLRDTVETLLARARAEAPPDAKAPKALIAPHAGYVYSGPVAAAAYARLYAAQDRLSRVVLLGPSHRVAFRGLALCTAEAYQTPLGTIPLDRATQDRLRRLPMVGDLDAAHVQEHSLEVHLPFLQTVLGAFQLVPVVTGDVTGDDVARLLAAAWGGPETLVVVSTDLSHYLDYPSCRALDGATAAAIERFDPSAIGREQACGRVPMSGLLNEARRRGMSIEMLDVRNSGDTAGSKDRVVGYGAWALSEPPSGDEAARLRALGPTLLSLAWAAIDHGLAEGAPPPARPLPPELSGPGAVFVTLKRQGQLRGCIGSPVAWRGLGEDVTDNAFKAAFRDPRFPPLTVSERQDLDLSVSVLTPPEPMRFADQADLLAQLRPRTDGVIIEDGGRRALFLPSVWEQLPDPQQFLAHLKQKAGLHPGHWSPTFQASRFQAVEIKPS